jgi:hypothetical protein
MTIIDDVSFLGGSLNSYRSGLYIPPTPEQIKHVMKTYNLDVKTIAFIVGSVYNEEKYDCSTVRGWLKGNRPIPYPSWRLILLKAEIISIKDL